MFLTKGNLFSHSKSHFQKARKRHGSYLLKPINICCKQNSSHLKSKKIEHLNLEA